MTGTGPGHCLPPRRGGRDRDDLSDWLARAAHDRLQVPVSGVLARELEFVGADTARVPGIVQKY